MRRTVSKDNKIFSAKMSEENEAGGLNVANTPRVEGGSPCGSDS